MPYDPMEEAPDAGRKTLTKDNRLPGCCLGVIVYGVAPFVLWIISLFI